MSYALQQAYNTGTYLTKGRGQTHSAGHDAPQEAAGSHHLGAIIPISHQAAQGGCKGLQDSRLSTLGDAPVFVTGVPPDCSEESGNGLQISRHSFYKGRLTRGAVGPQPGC